MKPRHPLISAWVGRGNFGDELLAYGLRLELYRIADITRIAYHETGDHSIFRASDDAPIEAQLNARDGRLRRLFDRFATSRREHDVLVFGGGSVLHSEHSIRWKHRLLRQFRRGARGSGRVAVGAGLSLGPFATPGAVNLVRDMISDLDLLVCRDLSSANFARELGTSTLIVDGRDLAYGVKAHHPEMFLKDEAGNPVGMSFILHPTLDEGRRALHLARMSGIVDQVTSTGRRVVLVALYAGGKYGDDRLVDRLHAAALHPERVSVHHYSGDVLATARRIASCTQFLSMRLHGVISAYLSGIPVLPLNRHPKVVEFARETKLTGDDETVDLDSRPEDIERYVARLLSSPPESHHVDPAADVRYRDSIAALRAVIG